MSASDGSEKCKHESTWFDRTVCPRDNGSYGMADICDDCAKEVWPEDSSASETVKDSIPWEHSPSDVCRFCGGDIRYHQYEDYVECKEKEIASLTERVKELEEKLSDETYYCQGVRNTVSELQSQLDAANKRNEEMEKSLKLEVDLHQHSLVQYHFLDKKLQTANETISALTRQLDKQGEALKAIVDLDPVKDSSSGYNEWGEAECFNKAQEIAKDALRPAAEIREGK